MELKEVKKELNDLYDIAEIVLPEYSTEKITYRISEKQRIAILTVLQALDNSIPKEKVKEGIESIEYYFDRLNGPDEDMDFIRETKQELLEE